MTEKTIQLSEDAPSQTENHPLGMAWRKGDLATIFQREGEWFFVLHGVGTGGNYYESDDYGPYVSAEEAEAEAIDLHNAIQRG